MAKQSTVYDPLASVIAEAQAPRSVIQNVSITTPAPKPEAPSKPDVAPGEAPKTYVVLETIKVSINHQMALLPKDHLVSEFGYDVDKLAAAGVKLELVK